MVDKNTAMKFLASFLAMIVVVITPGCRKYASAPVVLADRKIRFQLYTNKDFSDDSSVIAFAIFIKDKNGILLDSALAPMQIREIPNSAHKLVIEKTVAENNNWDLAAGFRYEIQNVGFSGYIDTSKAGNQLKVIDYAFQ